MILLFTELSCIIHIDYRCRKEADSNVQPNCKRDEVSSRGEICTQGSCCEKLHVSLHV